MASATLALTKALAWRLSVPVLVLEIGISGQVHVPARPHEGAEADAVVARGCERSEERPELVRSEKLNGVLVVEPAHSRVVARLKRVVAGDLHQLLLHVLDRALGRRLLAHDATRAREVPGPDVLLLHEDAVNEVDPALERVASVIESVNHRSMEIRTLPFSLCTSAAQTQSQDLCVRASTRSTAGTTSRKIWPCGCIISPAACETSGPVPLDLLLRRWCSLSSLIPLQIRRRAIRIFEVKHSLAASKWVNTRINE